MRWPSRLHQTPPRSECKSAFSCAASGAAPAGSAGGHKERDRVTALLVKSLLVRDANRQLTLTDGGRAALRALLPGL